MRTSFRWVVGALLVPAVIACSGTRNTGYDDVNGPLATGDDSGGGGGSSSGFSTGSGSGVFAGADSGPQAASDSRCKAGHYGGMFVGLYTSHLTGVGFPIPVTGNVDLNLDQAGGSGMQCKIEGEGLEDCSNVFTLKDGTITGIADGITTDAGTIGGFPYFCTMTGTLDCAAQKLDDGWIECTYCVGPLADGGGACTLLNGIGGTTGVGGHFAGTLDASYDYGTAAFVDGAWNGAEALAGNDGGSPGPEGGPATNYLSDSGLYAGPGDFGGSGHWNAAHQ